MSNADINSNTYSYTYTTTTTSHRMFILTVTLLGPGQEEH